MAHDPWDSTHWYIDEGDDTVNKEATAAWHPADITQKEALRI